MKKTVLWVLSILLAASAGSGGLIAAASRDFADPVDSGLALIGAPVVTAEVRSAADLEALADTAVQSALLELNGELEVVAPDGTAICGLSEAIAGLDGVLPVLRVDSEAEKTALLSWLAQNSSVTDLSVLSPSIRLLSELGDACVYLRTMYQPEVFESAAQLVREANLAGGAQTVVLELGMADFEEIRFVRARFKSVWLRTEEGLGAAEAVGLSADGIVSPDAEGVLNTLERLEGDSRLASVPFSVAHRGYTAGAVENTADAIRGAVGIGATHVEIDIRMTADDRVILLHNDDISSVTNGSGKVRDMTLEEVKQYTMRDGQTIPTLEEVLEEIRGEDIVLIVEVKTEQPEIMPLFAEIVEREGVADQIAVISFYPAQLLLARALLPEISTSLLLYTSSLEVAVPSANTCDSGVDMQYTNLSNFYGPDAYADFVLQLKARGYAPWLWTYAGNTVTEAVRNGVTGITSDQANLMSSLLEKVTVDAVCEVEDLAALADGFVVQAVTFAGGTVTVRAEVIFLSGAPEAGDTTAEAILCCRNGSNPAVFSQKVTFVRAEEPPEESSEPTPPESSEPDSSQPAPPDSSDPVEEPDPGCGGCSGSTAAGSLLLAGASLAAVMLIKRRSGYEK